MNITLRGISRNLNTTPFRDSRIFNVLLLISSCCLFKGVKKAYSSEWNTCVIFHLFRKTGHSCWKIKWFVSFHLGTLSEDLRRSNFCTFFSLFSRFGYNLLWLVLKLYSPFSVRPYNCAPCLPSRPRPLTTSPPKFSLPLFPVFFFSF